MDRITILGIPIDNVTEDEAVERIAGFLAAGGAHQVVTTNPEFVMEGRRNPTFHVVLQQADLSVPDGFGLILASRWLGMPLRGRATGVALSHRIAELAAQRGYRLFLLGAAPGVAEEAAAVWQAMYPGLQIAGCFAGSPHARYEPFLRQVVRAARPDVLLVAYGHPAQDLWIARNQPFIQVPLAMGVGGVFDYVTGRVPFAPAWLRRLGLEWLYRLVHQPRRWRRILVAVPWFSLVVFLDSLRNLGRDGGRGSGRRASRKDAKAQRFEQD
jgi:N-acetylglucosaminyldiphosphoundecaprenol N-acetyl-beta-D-mannosaminyltransferase